MKKKYGGGREYLSLPGGVGGFEAYFRYRNNPPLIRACFFKIDIQLEESKFIFFRIFFLQNSSFLKKNSESYHKRKIRKIHQNQENTKLRKIERKSCRLQSCKLNFSPLFFMMTLVISFFLFPEDGC